MQNNSYSWSESFLFSQQYESSGSNHSLLVVEDFIRTFSSPEIPGIDDEIPPKDHPEETEVHPLEINLSQVEGKGNAEGQRKRKISSTLEGSKKAKYSRKSSPSKLGPKAEGKRPDRSGECCDCKQHFTYIARHKSKHPEGLRKCTVRGCKKYFGCDNSRLEHEQKDHPPVTIRNKFFCCEHCRYSSEVRSHFENHLLKIHMERRFKCSQENCEKKFATVGHMNKHVKVTHSYVKCPSCLKLKTLGSIKGHVRKGKCSK